MSLFVVTGTDTGVGKTFVTSALVKALRQRGADAIALKPVETGWDEATSDAANLASASGRSTAETVWAHFTLPAAPAVAAAAESKQINPKDLVAWLRATAAGHSICLAEGAGGWKVPFDNARLFCDLVESLAPDGVLLVAASRLGTINHTLLTAEAIERVAPLKAIALSIRPADPPLEAEMHLDEIAKRVSVPVLPVPTALDRLVDLFHVKH
jgi:dethiobiotin synthetase